MIRIHAVRAVRSGIDKMQAELTVVAVIGDILCAVGLTVDRAEELTRARRNHHRAALVADGARRGYTVDFAQRRRIRRGQRLGVDVVAGGLNVDVQRLAGGQIGQLDGLTLGNA